MFKTFIFVRKSRFRKKLHLYKMAFSLIFDWVSLFYTLALVSYIGFAIINDGDISSWRFQFDSVMNGVVLNRIWSVLTVVPLAMLFRSFQYPGMMFTSAERMVTILPNSLPHIWLFTAISKWMKSTFVYAILGTILYLFSPSSVSIILLYIFVLLMLTILMTPIEWKFFQLHILKKIVLIILVIGINILSVLFNSPLFGIGFLIILFMTSVLAYKNRFNNIAWEQITSACDFKLWNMKLISQVSKTRFKRDRQYSVWQRLSFWKKPFPFGKQTMYVRLWFIYFERNFFMILKFFGSMLLLLFVFVFINDFIFFIGVAFVIHAYTSLVASLYKDRLTTDIVQIIPWDVNRYKKSLYRWVALSGVIFLIPLALYAVLNFQEIIFIQLLLILMAFQILFHGKVDKLIQNWRTTNKSYSMSSLIGYGLLICLILSTGDSIFLYVGVGLIIVQLIYQLLSPQRA